MTNNKDDRTDHQAMPVLSGVKYGVNLWIHQRDYKTPYVIGATSKMSKGALLEKFHGIQYRRFLSRETDYLNLFSERLLSTRFTYR
jgi:hypothetical protein